ncbi:MAG: pyrimidine dimer DNA glycosylase/endonuclease V [Halobacteria archaeon]
MTRMWGVAPVLLCDDHLLGEHNEMHMIVGTIRKHQHGEAIVQGHADKGQIDTSLIQERHDELKEEMIARGMEHESPMDYENELDIGEVDSQRSQEILRDRCEMCSGRMELKPDVSTRVMEEVGND